MDFILLLTVYQNIENQRRNDMYIDITREEIYNAHSINKLDSHKQQLMDVLTIGALSDYEKIS